MSRAGQHDVYLLGLTMPMSKGLALTRLDDQVIEASLLGAEILASEARLLGFRETVLERRVFDLPQILFV